MCGGGGGGGADSRDAAGRPAIAVTLTEGRKGRAAVGGGGQSLWGPTAHGGTLRKSSQS